MAHKYDAIPSNLKTDLKQIVYSFSPENLSCDGECRGAQLDAKINRLCKEWAGLAVKTFVACGVEVDFDEFEEYMY